MNQKQIQLSAKKYDLNFKEFEFEANSKNALIVQILANEKGLGHEYSLATYKSFFEEGLNISKKETVKSIAKSIGLDEDDIDLALSSEKYHDLLKQNMIQAKENGVKKFPTFIINDTHVIEGSPNEKKLRAILSSI